MNHESRIMNSESGGSIAPRPSAQPARHEFRDGRLPRRRTRPFLSREDQEMLAWELVIDPVEPETLVLYLELHLRHGHLVRRQYGNSGILRPVFEQHEPARGLERLTNVLKHPLGFGEFVIDVH